MECSKLCWVCKMSVLGRLAGGRDRLESGDGCGLDWVGGGLDGVGMGGETLGVHNSWQVDSSFIARCWSDGSF